LKDSLIVVFCACSVGHRVSADFVLFSLFDFKISGILT